MTGDEETRRVAMTHPDNLNNAPEEQEETLAQKVQNMGLMLVVMTPLLTGLGYLEELGNQKEDQRLLDKMTEEQHSVVAFAAQNDTCGTLRHNFSRICYKLKNEVEQSQNSVATLDTTSIEHETPVL